MKKRFATLIVTTLVAGMVLSACSASTTSDTTTQASQTDETKGTDATANGETPTKETQAETVAPTYPEIDTHVEEIATQAPTLSVCDDIFVQPVEGLNDDFVLGCDVSSILSEEQSGVIYYDEAGEPSDLLTILAQHGVNTIRVRVWNDPYDENGHGYGGGNNDIEKAVEIGKRAAALGMKLMVDFHYSDFWADPAKQMVPKAWKDLSVDEKAEACYAYTRESMAKLYQAGIDVNIVQIGNETTTGMSGITKWPNICKVMNAGSKAIREVSALFHKEVQIAVHFTNPENTTSYAGYAAQLDKNEVDYDIFASSYYPVWHGTLENLTTVLSDVATQYGKKVMVAEVSYPYTFENGDQFANSLGEDTSCDYSYSISAQGQANVIRDVAAAVAACGDAGIGICYWEPAWLPVPGDSYDEQLALWEEYGSGWASSYSVSYDPNDAGKWYGGSSWDNQALFDFAGHPLASLSTFAYLSTGHETKLAIDDIAIETVEAILGEQVVLPDKVNAVMNDRSFVAIDVTWHDTNTYNAIDRYQVSGTCSYDGIEYEAKCIVKIIEVNYVQNMSFEEEDLSMWKITASDTTDEAFVISKVSDAYDGSSSFHFYGKGAVSCEVSQEVSGLTPGQTYKLSAVVHGGDAGSAADQSVVFFANTGDNLYTDKATLTEWCDYQFPVVKGIVCGEDGSMTIGMAIDTIAGSWGNVDYFVLTPTVE